MAYQSGRRNGGRGPARNYGRNGAPQGLDPRVLYGILGGGGLVVVILLAVLLAGGRKNNLPAPVPNVAPLHSEAVARPPTPAVKPNEPPRPLTQAEKDQVHSVVTRLASREGEVRRLVKEGFEAQDTGDREGAQAAWKEANGLLTEMIEEAETLFERIGDERVEAYASQDYRAAGEWPRLRAEFFKYIESR